MSIDLILAGSFLIGSLLGIIVGLYSQSRINMKVKNMFNQKGDY